MEKQKSFKPKQTAGGEGPAAAAQEVPAEIKGDADLLKMLTAGAAQEAEAESQRVGQLGLGFDRNASKEDLENLRRLKELKTKYESKSGNANKNGGDAVATKT
jgi:hypothetical protein